MSELGAIMRAAFLESAVMTFQKMILVELSFCATEPPSDAWEFSGIIGFSGDLTGHCALRMSMSTAREAITRLAGENIEDVGELSDGVGELVNMIAGNARTKLSDSRISLSFPDVIRGKGHEIGFHRHSEIVSLNFTSEIGDIAVLAAFGEANSTANGSILPTKKG